MQKSVLSGNFDTSLCFSEENKLFMEGLLSLIKEKPLGKILGEQIRTYVLDFVKTHPLDTYKRFSAESYVRNYIGRDQETQWEALVMNWQKGNRTTIHSHPQFAGYTFAEGEFRVEIFKPAGPGIRLQKILHITEPCGLYAIGKAGRFDNHIHRITCLSEKAHSLHVYSDDALKGQVYQEKDIQE